MEAENKLKAIAIEAMKRLNGDNYLYYEFSENNKKIQESEFKKECCNICGGQELRPLVAFKELNKKYASEYFTFYCSVCGYFNAMSFSINHNPDFLNSIISIFKRL